MQDTITTNLGSQATTLILTNDIEKQIVSLLLAKKFNEANVLLDGKLRKCLIDGKPILEVAIENTMHDLFVFLTVGIECPKVNISLSLMVNVCRTDNLKFLKDLVFAHYNLIELEDGRNSLEVAVLFGTPQILEFLLNYISTKENKSRKDIINRAQQNSWTLLHIASANGNAPIVNFLLIYGADINAKQIHNATPLHLAVYYEQLEIATILLAYGADIYAKDSQGKTPLEVVNSENNNFINVLAFIIQTNKESIYYSIENNQTERIKEDFTRLKIQSIWHFVKENFLSTAVKKSSLDVIRLLLSEGYDPEAMENGQNALMNAVIADRTEVLDCLVEHISKNKNIDIIKVVNMFYNGCTLLHCATHAGKVKTIDFLLERGAEIDAKGKNELTPLHLAFMTSHKSVAELLIKRGANTTSKDKAGQTPFEKLSLTIQFNLQKLSYLVDFAMNLTSFAKQSVTQDDLSENFLEFDRLSLKSTVGPKLDRSSYDPLENADALLTKTIHMIDAVIQMFSENKFLSFIKMMLFHYMVSLIQNYVDERYLPENYYSMLKKVAASYAEKGTAIAQQFIDEFLKNVNSGSLILYDTLIKFLHAQGKFAEIESFCIAKNHTNYYVISEAHFDSHALLPYLKNQYDVYIANIHSNSSPEMLEKLAQFFIFLQLDNSNRLANANMYFSEESRNMRQCSTNNSVDNQLVPSVMNLSLGNNVTHAPSNLFFKPLSQNKSNNSVVQSSTSIVNAPDINNNNISNNNNMY